MSLFYEGNGRSSKAPKDLPRGQRARAMDPAKYVADRGLVDAVNTALLLGQPVLRLYLLAEHGRCPFVANMFENTRTTFTNALVRRLAWNMPYHAEHHAWPVVPFHRLPDLHVMTAPHLRVTAPGYAAFTVDYAQGR